MFYMSKILFFNLNKLIIILSFIFFDNQLLSEWVSLQENIISIEIYQFLKRVKMLVKSKNNALRKALVRELQVKN